MNDLEFIVMLSNAIQSIQEKFRSDHSRGQLRREYQDSLSALDTLKRKKMEQLTPGQGSFFREPIDP